MLMLAGLLGLFAVGGAVMLEVTPTEDTDEDDFANAGPDDILDGPDGDGEPLGLLDSLHISDNSENAGGSGEE